MVLEIASELLGSDDQPYRQAKVLLREGSGEGWPFALYGSATIEGIHEVVAGKSALAIVNPSTALRMAYLGTGPFDAPLPVRLLAVIPSGDQLAFAVRRDTGLQRFEEIASRRFPLHVRTRGTRDHALHFMIDAIMSATGFSADLLSSWGGEFRREGGFPTLGTPPVEALARGEYEAFFEEGADEWLDVALNAGMTVLPLAEATLQALEGAGFRRATIGRARYPQLPSDIPTVSFSGWPIFVRADLPDPMVTHFCAALDARKENIPWQGDGPLPVERMCRDAFDTPLDVPFHPAAERYWQSRGYMSAC